MNRRLPTALLLTGLIATLLAAESAEAQGYLWRPPCEHTREAYASLSASHSFVYGVRQNRMPLVGSWLRPLGEGYQMQMQFDGNGRFSWAILSPWGRRLESGAGTYRYQPQGYAGGALKLYTPSGVNGPIAVSFDDGGHVAALVTGGRVELLYRY